MEAKEPVNSRHPGAVRRPSVPGEAYRRVLLVGIMGSGKTTVGRKLAHKLGWHFADVDRLVEAECGLSVAELFADRGENAFRAAEARVTSRELARDRIVVAPGGGWAAQDATRLSSLPSTILSVWLRTSPEVATDRLTSPAGRGSPDLGRPLLPPSGRLHTLAHLATERAPYYAGAMRSWTPMDWGCQRWPTEYIRL